MKETPIGITLDGRLIVMKEPTNAEILAALDKETQNERLNSELQNKFNRRRFGIDSHKR